MKSCINCFFIFVVVVEIKDVPELMRYFNSWYRAYLRFELHETNGFKVMKVFMSEIWQDLRARLSKSVPYLGLCDSRVLRSLFKKNVKYSIIPNSYIPNLKFIAVSVLS